MRCTKAIIEKQYRNSFSDYSLIDIFFNKATNCLIGSTKNTDNRVPCPCFRTCKMMCQQKQLKCKLHRLSGILCTSFLINTYLILKGHQNYEPIRYVKIISSKIISQYTGDNSHALEHGCMPIRYCCQKFACHILV